MDLADQPVWTAFRASEQEYDRAIADLTRALQDHQDTLSPETIAVIEANLKTIDEAIRVAKAALEADPGNQRSVHMILAMYRKKVDLLQRAVALFQEHSS